MRLDVTRSQYVGLVLASALFSIALWLRAVLVGHDWRLFVISEVLLLAALWGIGLWILHRYADEWGPYFIWNWRRKDDPSGER